MSKAHEQKKNEEKLANGKQKKWRERKEFRPVRCVVVHKTLVYGIWILKMHVCICGSSEILMFRPPIPWHCVLLAECLYGRLVCRYLCVIKIGIMLVWVIWATSSEAAAARAATDWAAATSSKALNACATTTRHSRWCDCTQAFADNNKNCMYYILRQSAHLMFRARMSETLQVQ